MVNYKALNTDRKKVTQMCNLFKLLHLRHFLLVLKTNAESHGQRRERWTEISVQHLARTVFGIHT